VSGSIGKHLSINPLGAQEIAMPMQVDRSIEAVIHRSRAGTCLRIIAALDS
jgi:hypothetical protein